MDSLLTTTSITILRVLSKVVKAFSVNFVGHSFIFEEWQHMFQRWTVQDFSAFIAAEGSSFLT